MRLLLGFLPFLLLVCGLAAQLTSADDSAIRELVKRYVDARNHKDAAAVRELFTPDADQLVSTGEWRRGLDALLQGAMASSRKETGQSSVTLESVRLLNSDTAIADGRYQTTSIGDAAPRKMRSTFIVVRTKAGWRIAAIRNMLPAPAPPK
jgi:uncharacterized protein (TIGR02246 family)